MDLINNLVYTAANAVGGYPRIRNNYFGYPAGMLVGLPNNPVPPSLIGGVYRYPTDVLYAFCAYDDPEYIEDAIQKHWADITDNLPVAPNPYARNYRMGPAEVSIFVKYPNPGDPPVRTPPYHLIYAYLVENTRAFQIFERLIYLYQHDEFLKKATGGAPNTLAFQWLQNTETLFFKYLSPTSYRNISSSVRPLTDATRRNAYYRLLGMDLSFGDPTNANIDYLKAELNNQSFTMLFERFLMEVWQAYTNARNTSGANSTDYFSITDTAEKVQEMLMSRRSTNFDFADYRYTNLAKEEYASVVMASWIYFILSHNSPIVEFLRCTANTPAERLQNIANRVSAYEADMHRYGGKRLEISAHSKSFSLLDMAPAMNTLLRRIELGDYNPGSVGNVQRIIESKTGLLAPGATAGEIMALDDLLLIINNWERATGHTLKNPQQRLNGVVKVQPNGTALRSNPVLN